MVAPLLLTVKLSLASRKILALVVAAVALPYAAQIVLVPPFAPLQVQTQGPLPAMLAVVPVVHKPVDGVALRVAP